MKVAELRHHALLALILIGPFASGRALAQGVYRELWPNLTASQGNSLAALTNTLYNPNWPNNPNAAYSRVFTNFETETNILDNYGQRVRAFVVPPTNGAYTFWIATDDSGQLFLSSDEDPANKIAIASVATWALPREWGKEPNQQSAPVTLQARQRYYLEAIMLENSGGDNLAVRWRLPNGTIEEPLSATSPAGTRLIPFTGLTSTPGLFTQPTNTTVAEGSDAAFWLLATNQAPLNYQWQRNSTNLSGATRAFLTVSNTSFAADNGAVFRCLVSNAAGSITSAPVTLTVLADTAPPTLSSALNQDFTHVLIRYSEPVEAASATNALNYSITGGVSVSAGSLADERTVSLTVSPLTLSNSYTITVNNVRDRASAPNTIAPGSQISFLAQSYGLSMRPNIGAFLDGQIPPAAPALSGNWSAVVAFANLYFTNALGLAAMPGTSKLIVWEREGRIYSFTNSAGVGAKTLVLDIHNQCQGWDDSGLLNVAFHPGFATNRYLFVYYTWVPPGTVVGDPNNRPVQFLTDAYHDRLSRFTLDADGVAVPGSELVLVDQTGTSTWHNGSGMFFHPGNGFLYVTDGDDADGSNDQIITKSLFSGIWRLDVDMRGGAISHPIPRQPVKGTTANYYIPNDNPFVGQSNVLEEFYGIGLRSPHRMTIDPPSGRIFIGDVGESAREEIDVIEPTDPPGQNFQWNIIEGLQGDLTPPYIGINHRPLFDYTHGDGQAVIGGYVYRGGEFAADLGGKYIFGDNVSRSVWVLDESVTPPAKIFLCTLPQGSGPNSGLDYTGLSSFGLDASNELYLCQMSSVGGRIYRLARSGPPPASQPFPPLLSQTGVFTNLAALAPRPELIPYTVNSPLWSDSAVKTRWVAVPTNTFIHFTATGEWTFPNGTVFVKHFDLPVDDSNPNILRRLETRLLARDSNGAAYGITYRWRADHSDADLVTNALFEDIAINTGSGTRTQQWFYPGPLDCLRCHTPAAGYVLGVKTRQLNGSFAYPGSGLTDNQLRAWNHLELFDVALNESAIATYDKLVKVNDLTASLTNRVRSYLDANCAQCHRPGGVPAFWDARYDTPLASQNIINGNVGNTLGISGAREVFPQDIARSIMYLRLSRLDAFKMPPLARNTVDSNAVATLAEWINGLASPLPSSLVAYYPFDGDAQDGSGNGNHGTAAGVSYVAGRVGTAAAQFNGGSAYVQIPRSISTDFTVAFWVKTTDTGGTGAQWWSGKGLVDGEVAGGSADWGTVVLNGKFALGAGNADTTLSSSTSINDGAWHHVAATRDNTAGTMAVYVDGILRGSGAGPTGARTAPPTLRIGSIQTGTAAGYLNGAVDDVRLYDRVLSAGEISALVNPPAAPAGLAAIAGDAQVALSWNASSGAINYYLKRSGASGGPYAVIATNAGVAFANTGLSNGTMYYYVVSAVNAAGEGADSAPAAARPTASTPTQINFVVAGNQIQFTWPLDHIGWQLQAQSNAPGVGLGTNWVTLSSSVSTNQFLMPVGAANGSVFFRLVHP